MSKYTLYQKQQGLTGTVAVNGSQVEFVLLEGDDESRSTESVAAPVVVGPTLFGFIYQNWDRLVSGERLTVRFAVLSRLETIGFNFQKVESEAGKLTVEMSPSNGLIGLIVDPIHFAFELPSNQLLTMRGRVPPKLDVDGALKDFDARVEYRNSGPFR